MRSVAPVTDESSLVGEVSVRSGDWIHYASLPSSLGAVQFSSRYPILPDYTKNVDRLSNTGLPTMKGLTPRQPSSLLIWILGSSHQVNTFYS